MRIKLETDGINIFVRTSRPLRENEHVCLLRRGRGICTTPYGTNPTHPKSKYRWHVYYRWSGIPTIEGLAIKNLRYPWHLDDDGKLCFDAPTRLPYRWFIDYVDENGHSTLPPEDETIPHLAYGGGAASKRPMRQNLFSANIIKMAGEYLLAADVCVSA